MLRMQPLSRGSDEGAGRVEAVLDDKVPVTHRKLLRLTRAVWRA